MSVRERNRRSTCERARLSFVARDPAALDADGDGGELEAHAGDAGHLAAAAVACQQRGTADVVPEIVEAAALDASSSAESSAVNW